MTGRLKEARATLEQGIEADPTYPMFHYNLACTFSEMNDLDRTMQSLATALRHRKNLNPGDKAMPDPRQDSPFQRFMKNETFRNFVNDLTATKSYALSFVALLPQSRTVAETSLDNESILNPSADASIHAPSRASQTARTGRGRE